MTGLGDLLQRNSVQVRVIPRAPLAAPWPPGEVVHFYVAAVVKPFLRLLSFLYSCFKEPCAIGRTCIAHLSQASSYEQAAP